MAFPALRINFSFAALESVNFRKSIVSPKPTQSLNRVAPGEAGIAAKLVGRSFYGENCEWEFVAPGDVKLVVRESAPPERKLGNEYKLSFEPGFFMALPREDGDE